MSCILQLLRLQHGTSGVWKEAEWLGVHSIRPSCCASQFAEDPRSIPRLRWSGFWQSWAKTDPLFLVWLGRSFFFFFLIFVQCVTFWGKDKNLFETWVYFCFFNRDFFDYTVSFFLIIWKCPLIWYLFFSMSCLSWNLPTLHYSKGEYLLLSSYTFVGHVQPASLAVL